MCELAFNILWVQQEGTQICMSERSQVESNRRTEKNVYRGASLFAHATKYYERDQITTMRWAEYIARVGTKDIYRILVGESERKGTLGKPRHRWEHKN
jgi:hypothetical protein